MTGIPPPAATRHEHDSAAGATCPACRAPMQIHRFKRHLHGEIALDICFACQGIWFDDFESVQLAPAGVLELFRLLHEHHDDPRQPWRDTLQCPRCNDACCTGSIAPATEASPITAARRNTVASIPFRPSCPKGLCPSAERRRNRRPRAPSAGHPLCRLRCAGRYSPRQRLQPLPLTDRDPRSGGGARRARRI